MARRKIVITEPKIVAFLKNVKKKLAPSKIILFGSRCKGKEMNYSDWDFLIISNKFKEVNFRDRLDILLDLIEKGTKQHIEALGYPEEEFEERKNGLSIVGTAFKEGLEVEI